jgi:hypothetical protein
MITYLPRILWAAAIAVAITAPPIPGYADPPRTTGDTRPSGEPRDGQHDFDFLLGRWKIQLRRLKNPLHGSTEWYEGTGTSFARPLWNGKAQVEEFEVDTSAGHIQGLTLRLYSTTARQWSLYWANQKIGHMDVPTVGEFKDGRGEFFDQELFEGRSILVRYAWSNITAKSAYFEQSFSPDGGKTWETNWTTQLTRIE